MAKPPDIDVGPATELSVADLDSLCEATELAIREGGGFGWVDIPERRTLEAFWRGALVIPERTLFLGRLDGVVAGTAQLIRPARNNEAQGMAASLTTSFVAPWARGHGMARRLVTVVEEAAVEGGFCILNLDVRETQEVAIALYRSMGYVHWGTNPHYAHVGGEWVQGLFFYKDLTGSVAG